MRIRRFLHFLLFLVVCLLVWRIVEAWQRPLVGQRTAAKPNSTEEKSLPLYRAISPQVGKRFANIIADKDLFVPSRSRAQEEVKPVEAVPPPSHLKLVGVVLAFGKEEAFFADSTQGGKVIRARKGESLGSYKVVSVAPLQATLTMGPEEGEEVSLPLLILDSTTAAQAPRLVPQMNENQGRAGQAFDHSGDAVGESPPQAESHAIRQNIQQLQRRLRQIRRQAAQDGEEGAEDFGDDEGNEEEGEEE